MNLATVSNKTHLWAVQTFDKGYKGRGLLRLPFILVSLLALHSMLSEAQGLYWNMLVLCHWHKAGMMGLLLMQPNP